LSELATILIYHPNKILLPRLVKFIQAAGYEPLSTSSDSEALQLLREMKPDIFLIAPLLAGDLNIAEDAPTKHPSTRFVVLAETDEIAESAQEAFVDEVILYDETNVGNVLEALHRLSPSAGPPPSTEGAGVLIVDDESDSVEVLAECLKQRGYHAFGAATGTEALSTLKSNADIRVVLLDIKLPDIGGLELLREITTLREPPAVIMLTAIRDSVIAKSAFRIGASDYLVKPIELKALDEAITVALTRREYRTNWRKQREA
jgi:DNA-binding response OmpR family regulator